MRLSRRDKMDAPPLMSGGVVGKVMHQSMLLERLTKENCRDAP